MAADPSVPTSAAALPSGAEMPLLGFGTWQITGPDAERATAAALRAGYRHIDTATLYTNEAEVGAALADCGVDREALFITTKLPGNDAGDPERTLSESLRKLRLSYLDLWLIHWPTGDDRPVWDALIKAKDQGLVRDIGVSNFSLEQLDELAESGTMPAVNQIHLSPLKFDPAVAEGHRERGVVLEGYSALRGGTLEDPVIGEIATRLGRTAAQVIIRWHLQHDIVVIPKSANEERIVSNAQVDDFELTEADMAAIDGLSQPA
jgi:diketogulonate reductase-like aldo/keto reductase